MSSRQEEKERRRKERLEREQAEAKRAARRKRMQLAFGGLLAVAAIAGIVVAVLISTGGDDGGPSKHGRRAPRTVKMPEQADLRHQGGREGGGLHAQQPRLRGRQPRAEDVQGVRLQDEPADVGQPHPDWYEDGIYAPGDIPELGKLVHPLEHGRIEIQYKKGTPKATVDQLEALLADSEDGYHMLLFENTTGMEAAGRRHGVDALADLPGDERQGLRRDPDVPGALHRQGPGARPLGA